MTAVSYFPELEHSENSIQARLGWELRSAKPFREWFDFAGKLAGSPFQRTALLGWRAVLQYRRAALRDWLGESRVNRGLSFALRLMNYLRERRYPKEQPARLPNFRNTIGLTLKRVSVSTCSEPRGC